MMADNSLDSCLMVSSMAWVSYYTPTGVTISVSSIKIREVVLAAWNSKTEMCTRANGPTINVMATELSPYRALKQFKKASGTVTF